MSDSDKKTLTPSEQMDATYKRKVPKLPDYVNRKDSNNILAYVTQCLPMKASTC